MAKRLGLRVHTHVYRDIYTYNIYIYTLERVERFKDD